MILLCCNDPFPVSSSDPGGHSRNNPLPAGQHPLHFWQVPWAGFRCKLMLGSRTLGAWLSIPHPMGAGLMICPGNAAPKCLDLYPNHH